MLYVLLTLLSVLIFEEESIYYVPIQPLPYMVIQTTLGQQACQPGNLCS